DRVDRRESRPQRDLGRRRRRADLTLDGTCESGEVARPIRADEARAVVARVAERTADRGHDVDLADQSRVRRAASAAGERGRELGPSCGGIVMRRDLQREVRATELAIEVALELNRESHRADAQPVAFGPRHLVEPAKLEDRQHDERRDHRRDRDEGFYILHDLLARGSRRGGARSLWCLMNRRHRITKSILCALVASACGSSGPTAQPTDDIPCLPAIPTHPPGDPCPAPSETRTLVPTSVRTSFVATADGYATCDLVPRPTYVRVTTLDDRVLTGEWIASHVQDYWTMAAPIATPLGSPTMVTQV